jgi:transcription antitermination protein NusB
VRRRKARELALKMLYQMETNGEDPEVALIKYCESFPYQEAVTDYARMLLAGVKQHRTSIDERIMASSEHWKPERITFVDKNILRIGIYELLFSPEVPPKVAIDEAIELSKKYGSEDSREFINGILDRVLRDLYKQESAERR